MRLYDARHTCATLLLEAGEAMKMVQGPSDGSVGCFRKRHGQITDTRGLETPKSLWAWWQSG
jgi:hypothetical protein